MTPKNWTLEGKKSSDMVGRGVKNDPKKSGHYLCMFPYIFQHHSYENSLAVNFHLRVA